VNKSEDICKAYIAGESISDIAARWDITRAAIYHHLYKSGVLLRYKKTDKYGVKPEDCKGTWVHRDPCPKCGVRQDIGCGHSGAPLSMGAF